MSRLIASHHRLKPVPPEVSRGQGGTGFSLWNSQSPTRGQAVMEFALLFGGVLIPMLFMVVFISRGLWIWHSVVDFTRYGARYAATHCWEPDGSGSNVISFMQANVPPMVDMNQFQNGQAILVVRYFSENPDGTTAPFDGTSCAGGICVPDTVSVSVTNYNFIGMSTYFSLPPVTIPDFTTSVPMENAGYQDASGVCVP